MQCGKIGRVSSMRSIHLEPSELEITSDGNLAFSFFTECVNLTTNTGERIGVVLRTTHIYKRIDGDWLIVHEHKSAPALNLHP